MNDGLYYNSAEAGAQLTEFKSYLNELTGTTDKIDSLLNTMESGWSGGQADTAITSFKTQKAGLIENASFLDGQLASLTSTYEAFDEARINL